MNRELDLQKILQGEVPTAHEREQAVLAAFRKMEMADNKNKI